MAILCPRCSSVDLVSSVDAAGFECLSCHTRFSAAGDATHVRTMGTDELEAAFAGVATTEEPTRIGERIGPYRIDGILGRGGMGIVYRAVHEQLQRVVALKMVRSLDDAEYRERFLIEARAVARLQHPHIVQIFEVGESDGSPYFALEMVEGGTLADLLDYGPLAADRAAGLLRSIAEAVAAAHQAGIVHRDLKPANILLTGDGQPKVADFGLAKHVDDPGLTRTGAIVGTPSYMAPEQAEGGELAAPAAADVYALGGILYAALTGRPPFQAASVLETIEQVRSRAPVAPRALVPTLPKDLETIALHCLQKEPERRYGSARELAKDLQRFLNHEPILARPVSAFERTSKWVRRNPSPAALIAAAVVVPVAALLGWMAYSENQFQLQQQEMAEQALQASMEDKLGTALEEMHAHIDASRWPEAMAAAERARSVAIEGVDPDLAETATQFHRDLALVVELERFWRQQTRVDTQENRFRYENTHLDYEALFERHGFHSKTSSSGEAVAALQEWPGTMKEAVLVSLEDWMFVAMQYEVDDMFRWVVDTLQGADTKVWRKTMRTTILAGDTERMHALLDEPEAVMENPQSLRVVAGVLRSAEAHDRAFRLLRDSHARNPGNLWSNHSLAMQLIMLDPPRWEESLRYFASALALDPENAGIMVNMAISHAKLGEHDQAEMLFRESVRLEPEYAGAHHNLGRTLLDRRDFTGALAAFDKAIEIQPNYASAHLNRGVALYQLRNPRAAVTSYDSAIELEPEDPVAHNNRAVALRALGRVGEAMASLERAIELDPEYADAHNTLGNYCELTGDLDRAEQLYRRAIELDAEGAHYNLASMLTRLGRLDEAIDLFEQAVGRTPNDAELWCNFSDALQSAGRFAEALEAIVEGHRLGSARPDWQYPSAAWLAETRTMAGLEARMDALLSGEETLVDTPTRLHFARMLRIKTRFADAARSYATAFAEQPAYAEDLSYGYRYWAAGSAAQASENPELSPTQRSELASWACQWVYADLQARRRSLGAGTAEVRLTVREKLSFWLDDPELVAIRDPQRLATLPVSVQAMCQQLWNEVRLTLQEISGL